MAELKGFVQYRFRSDESDTEVLLRGDAVWVRNKVAELGLEGVGWMMPIGQEAKATNTSGITTKTKGNVDIVIDDQPIGEKPLDMGPEPDPSRIPVVRRPIGELDLNSELRALGLDNLTKPDPIELMEIFSELDEPLPVQGTMSIDPMAEAWLRELMNIVVRDYGFTALKTGDIEEIASKKLGNREGTTLEVWLESLFSAGKLVKVHGGDAIGWGPSPRWLAGKV
ncbi:MAG TPA: hypothetical protein HA354_07330 [Candidatus Poseidoniaceae archaeon]|nr:hypothetical protein [Euryarchaeota archaeon]DAC56285.1 MAG TPA: hypothetical protein D7I07_07330 [Candidatus Poseidoniales archaeon]HII38297.1 hypothetical protein [Candidatus Poseidoniaceae archaeon]|tara:strand:- start:4051 stop:4725 length:675 start_codon:yes stop_codon:yes gene_type:complete